MLSNLTLYRVLVLLVTLLGVAQGVSSEWPLVQRQDSTNDSSSTPGNPSQSQPSEGSSSAISRSISSSSSSSTSPTSPSRSSTIPIHSSSSSSRSSQTHSQPAHSPSSSRVIHTSQPGPSSKHSTMKSRETHRQPGSTSSSHPKPTSSPESKTTVPLRGTLTSTHVYHKTVVDPNGSTTVKLLSSTRTFATITGHATRPVQLQDGSGVSGSGLSDRSKNIIGGVVGGIGGAILLGILAVFFWRRRQKRKQMEGGENLMGGDAYGGYSPRGYAIPDEKRFSRGSNQMLSDGSERYYSPGAATGPSTTAGDTNVTTPTADPPVLPHVNTASNF